MRASPFGRHSPRPPTTNQHATSGGGCTVGYASRLRCRDGGAAPVGWNGLVQFSAGLTEEWHYPAVWPEGAQRDLDDWPRLSPDDLPA
ncbi:hypothetical protein [Amycolatopsis sp. NPDC054798]